MTKAKNCMPTRLKIAPDKSAFWHQKLDHDKINIGMAWDDILNEAGERIRVQDAIDKITGH